MKRAGSDTKLDILDIIKSISESQVGKRSDHVVDAICNILEQVKFFKEIIYCTQSQRRNILREFSQILELEKFGQGQVIYKAGDTGDKFYVILQGQVDIYNPIEEPSKVSKEFQDLLMEYSYEKIILQFQNKFNQEYIEDGIFTLQRKIQKNNSFIDTPHRRISLVRARSLKIFTEEGFAAIHTKMEHIKEGGSFGEQTFTLNQARLQTVRITPNPNNKYAYFLTLNRQNFAKIQNYQNQQISIIHNALQKISPKSSYKSVMQYGQGLEVVTYPKNHYIYKESQESDSLYIIADGEVKLERKQNNYISKDLTKILMRYKEKRNLHSRSLAILSKGAIFGYDGQIIGQKRQNSALCLSQSVILYHLTYHKLGQMKMDIQIREEEIQYIDDFINQRHNQLEDIIQQKQINQQSHNEQTVELRFLVQTDLASQLEQKQNSNISLEYAKTSNTQRLTKNNFSFQMNRNHGPVLYNLILGGQGETIFNSHKIKQMIKHKKGIQRSYQKIQPNIDFKTPFFEDQAAMNFKQVRKIQSDFEKIKSPEKFKKEHAIQNFFKSDKQIDIRDLIEQINMVKRQASEVNCTNYSKSSFRQPSATNLINFNSGILQDNFSLSITRPSTSRVVSSSNHQFRFSASERKKLPSTHTIHSK